ncbi:LysR family transcriptional regulator [Paraburkholderia domus]|uniref:HTH-type transcriptional regulator HdfR n=1 Tax=Paraburkholderia domus TaxID=2793075 RepID=A0A9N8N8N0_9BURK|nr:LysR family transcriptional regulator [Paraburkholderia domus]CAE6844140.1 HTH-type transcriptional regulator HdfR [Paraburkholderia domus]CAE6960430.1 HTH-type transcriptional regulator HdfR [Paraburkholderia domus]CAE6965350.1 HTH-type transcriptional regulator HdfR [Paraburkholderia domus]
MLGLRTIEIEKTGDKLMAIDLVQLRTFVAVAEEQHLTRAAERLNISQSGASAQVRALEERLGTQLFVRTNRSLELTRAGQLLVQKAKALLNDEALFMSFVRELRGKIEGKLVVGTSSEPGTRIGEMIATVCARHPLVNIDLIARPSLGTRQGLKSGELDVGVLIGRPIDADFTYYELTTVQYKVAGPAAWKEKIVAADWSELASLPWLTPRSSPAYSALQAQLFGDKGLELNIVVRYDNAAIGRAALQAGAGMMLVREEYAVQGEREGYLAISPIIRTELALSVAHQSSRKDDPLVQAFIEAAKVSWPEMKLTKAVRDV